MTNKMKRIESTIDEETYQEICSSGKSIYQFVREAVIEKLNKKPDKTFERILTKFEKTNEENFIQIYKAILEEKKNTENTFYEMKNLNSKSMEAIKNAFEILRKG